jgi:hypothetical protein
MRIHRTPHHRQSPDLLQRAKTALEQALGDIEAMETALELQQQVIDGQAEEIARLKGEK